MFYQKITPSVALQPFVRFYYVWEHNQMPASPLEINSPPNGLGGIVFNYGDPYYTLTGKGKWERVPYCFAAGQFTRNYSLRLCGKIGMVGIVFWPAGLTHLLGTPMVEFTDQRVDMNLLLGKEAAIVEDQILESRTSRQRIEILERFLMHKFHTTSPVFDLVDSALNTIIQHKGILSISRLADDLCISPRQFRRRFTEKVGIAPKFYARIKRFNYISHLSANSFARWMDMVHEGGYYDQAHFIRDFCDFSGKKPSEFINYHRKMSQLMGT